MTQRISARYGRLLALAVAASVLVPMTPAFSADNGQKSQQSMAMKSDHATKDKWQNKDKKAGMKDWKKSDKSSNTMQSSMKSSMQGSMQGSH